MTDKVTVNCPNDCHRMPDSKIKMRLQPASQ